MVFRSTILKIGTKRVFLAIKMHKAIKKDKINNTKNATAGGEAGPFFFG